MYYSNLNLDIMSNGEASLRKTMSIIPNSSVSKAYQLLEEADKLLLLLKEFQREVSSSIKDLEEHELNDAEQENVSRINQVLSDLIDKTEDVYTEANDMYGKYHNNHISDYGAHTCGVA